MEKKNYSVEFGNRCRQIRMAKGLSQQDLADKMGTTPQNVSKWERDGISNVDTIMQLSEVLGQDITADEIDQEGSVGEIGKEILSLLIKNKGYIEWKDLKESLFGLPEDRICNEIFKLERIGNVVREQYKDWVDEQRDAIFITAKGIITIKNMGQFFLAGELADVISYEVRIKDQLNYNERIRKDELSQLIWRLPKQDSAYRADYIYYLIRNFRSEFSDGESGPYYRSGTGLWAEEYMPAEDCYFDTLFLWLLVYPMMIWLGQKKEQRKCRTGSMMHMKK
ncbi:MAG: helix-turn-helix domain-containing protein [Agathobacter sp.]|uniref:helix-turn-helix domain-containing protein n=1 Tax=Agathobacter sp. TaxID=2021311 RepID=UPI002586BA2D|nr:helix-turn-helix transcriptional regulator [Agathobacter sp.]MCR5676427.1 helix-turn-helix domain-containing protein [Agathobacter sp.]